MLALCQNLVALLVANNNSVIYSFQFLILFALQQILALISFVLVFLEFDYYHTQNADKYLVLVSFADWLTVAIMLISALLSLGTASILPKTSFDFIFHFIMGILIFVGGLLLSLNAFGRPGRSSKIQTATVSK